MPDASLSADNAVLLKQQVREPRRYAVILHNDDYTTMEFVISVLVDVFRKNLEEARAIMLMVHEKGRGVCGIYPAEVAETKAALVHGKARAAGYPLRCTLEVV